MSRTSFDTFDVVEWLRDFSQCRMSGTGWSNLRRDQASERALQAAVLMGAKFPLNAFQKHIGIWHTESVYALACEVNNRSCCRAIEISLNRPPFRWDGARMHEGFQWWHPDLRLHLRLTTFGIDAKKGHYCNALNVSCPEDKPIKPVLRKFDFDIEQPEPPPRGGRKRLRFFWSDIDQREKVRLAALKQAKQHRQVSA